MKISGSVGRQAAGVAGMMGPLRVDDVGSQASQGTSGLMHGALAGRLGS